MMMRKGRGAVKTLMVKTNPAVIIILFVGSVTHRDDTASRDESPPQLATLIRAKVVTRGPGRSTQELIVDVLLLMAGVAAT